MIRAIALDDEPPALLVLQILSQRSGMVDLLHTFTHPAEAAAFLQQHPVDLLFLDVRLPAISGLDFARSLPPSTQVVFTTAYADYALDAFNLQATDYLLKPYTLERFMQALKRVSARKLLAEQTQQPTNPPEESSSLLLRVGLAWVRLYVADILYLKAEGDYLRIHLDSGRPLLVRMALKAMLEKLPEGFFRIHRSYAVALNRVQQVRNRKVLVGGAELPLSAAYEPELLRLLKAL